MVACFGLLTASTYNNRPTSSVIMDPALKLNFYKNITLKLVILRKEQ